MQITFIHTQHVTPICLNKTAMGDFMKIFIDPGHGGKDPGAVAASGLQEAGVNLSVSLMLGQILQDQGIDVIYSRTTNVFVSLSDRAKMANDWGANYFVSVHCNSSEITSAGGSETLFYKPGGRAEALAGDIQVALVKANGLQNRGIKAQNVAVLRLTKMPACLVELGFLSNPEEAALLAKPEFQRICAQGIADGIDNYLSVRQSFVI